MTRNRSNGSTCGGSCARGQGCGQQDGDQPFTIRLRPATSSDADYDRLDADDVTGTNADDGEPTDDVPTPRWIWTLSTTLTRSWKLLK